MAYTIAVDFDGTLAEHRYPDIGPPVPGIAYWLTEFRRQGCKLILLTMRSDDGPDGPTLTQAVEWCSRLGLVFDHVNCNPDQDSWTSSRKVYANIYIDDAALGCPLRQSMRDGGRPVVDWDLCGPMVLRRMQEHQARRTA